MLMVVVALVMAAMMVAMAMPAFGAPPPQGSCEVGGVRGEVSGCAGAVGGFIDTEQQGCKNINRGPFNNNEFSCP
jgi:hypothetical protein